MKVKLPKFVVEVFEEFEKADFEIYLVGGAVRDLVMKKLVDDWDFTTNATPEEIQKVFPESFYDNKFGTVGMAIEGEKNPVEITTYRTEQGYSDKRRPDNVVWGKSLEEDLKRRDFTINALALTRNKNKRGEYEIKDFYEGRKDIEKKLIRAVGDANERFSEDALRMMRAVRIASELGFSIEKKTLEAIQKNAKLIKRIAKERVKQELFKIMASSYPFKGMTIFRKVGLMEEVLPEMEKAFGVEQKSPGRHHIHDVGTHCMLSLKHVAEKTQDPLVRFATMIHDIGKPQSYKKLKTGTITFYNHEIIGTTIAKRIADRLRFSNRETGRLIKLVRYHQFTLDENQTDKSIRRFLKKVGLENVEDMLNLRIGDRLGGGARETSWRFEEFKARIVEVQKEPFSVQDLKIKGHDIMKELNMEPGPKVGKLLNKLFKEVEDKKIPNEKEELLKRLKKI